MEATTVEFRIELPDGSWTELLNDGVGYTLYTYDAGVEGGLEHVPVTFTYNDGRELAWKYAKGLLNLEEFTLEFSGDWSEWEKAIG